MGTGLEVAGIIGSLAAAGAGVAGASESASAMNKATAAQVAGQEQLQKAATPIYNQNLQASSPKVTQQTLGSTMSNLINQYKNVGQQPATTQPLIAGSPGSGATNAATAADIARQQQSNAALNAYPQVGVNWNVGNTLTNARLGNIGAIGASLASAFPANLSAAQESGSTLTGIGSLLSGLSSAAGAYGAQSGNQSSYNNLMQQSLLQSGWNNLMNGYPTQANYSINQ